MKRVTNRDIKNMRWLLSKDLKIYRDEDAQNFVEKLGIISVFSDKVLPGLANAVYTDDLPNQFEVDQRVWDFAHTLMSSKRAYYGKLLKSRNTLISMKLFSCFLRLYSIPNYKKLYQKGNLGKMSKSIMDILLDAHPLMTIEIRKRLKIREKRDKKELKNALAELQEKQLICCIGKVAHCKCRWRFSLWAPTHKWIPDKVKSIAQTLLREEAMRKIIEKFVYSTIFTNARTIARFFRWPLNEVEDVIKSMVDLGVVSLYEFEGKRCLFKEVL